MSDNTGCHSPSEARWKPEELLLLELERERVP
jgi:hypothetical protein